MCDVQRSSLRRLSETGFDSDSTPLISNDLIAKLGKVPSSEGFQRGGHHNDEIDFFCSIF